MEDLSILEKKTGNADKMGRLLPGRAGSLGWGWGGAIHQPGSESTCCLETR